MILTITIFSKKEKQAMSDSNFQHVWDNVANFIQKLSKNRLPLL